MERYQPSTSSSSMSSCTSSGHPAPNSSQCFHHQNNHHHQDYSYAYYEPGAAMRHSNVPGTSSEAGPSRPPPPNSMRALLSKGRKNSPNASNNGTTRHMFTTRYGTQENIYEEVGSDERLRLMMMSSGQSMISLDQSMIEEEFRRVQHRHHRVLGELNLSVEALIMPSTPPNESPTEDGEEGNNGGSSNLPREEEPSCSATIQRRSNDFPLKPVQHQRVEEDLFSPSVCGNFVESGNSGVECNSGNNTGDLDSGFSGSSSGASYVGSLRYHRTNSAMSSSCCQQQQQHQQAQPNHGAMESGSHLGNYGSRFRSSLRSHEDPGMPFSTRSSSSYSSTRSHHHHHSHQHHQQQHPQHHHRPSHSLTNNQYPLHGQCQRSAEDPGPRSAHILNLNPMCSNSVGGETGGGTGDGKAKGSFWSKKGWKFPGFASTPSVNKAGCINF